MILVDTSILIDHLRGDARARALLADAVNSQRRLLGSVMTKVEVLAGMRSGEERATYGLLSLIEWIAVDETIADRAGELARRYLRTHPGVDPIDFVLAATSERRNATIWTRNRKHFPMYPSLTDPYSR